MKDIFIVVVDKTSIIGIYTDSKTAHIAALQANGKVMCWLEPDMIKETRNAAGGEHETQS